MEQQSFILGVVLFCLVVLAIIWVLSLFPGSLASRIAFLWIGPVPRQGESWARYQLRWATYSLGWLGQIACWFLLLRGAAYVFPSIEPYQLFMVFAVFALPIGAGMAVLAAAAFLLKAAKARLWGPNPMCDGYVAGAP
jgi:hypothetical protein